MLYNYIQINIIGDTLYINQMEKKKLKNTFTFSIIDCINNQSTKEFLKTLIKHFNNYDCVITFENLKYLKSLKLL